MAAAESTANEPCTMPFAVQKSNHTELVLEFSKVHISVPTGRSLVQGKRREGERREREQGLDQIVM
jgi:hypothetical protein